MSESYDKHRKIYVDYLKGESKTCPINGPGYSLDECKVLGDFGYNYDEIRPTKYHGYDNLPRKKFSRQKGHNAIVNSAVDEILLHEKKSKC